MKWIAIAAGVVVALIVLVVVIGSLLPRDHVATVSARIAAPPERGVGNDHAAATASRRGVPM